MLIVRANRSEFIIERKSTDNMFLVMFNFSNLNILANNVKIKFCLKILLLQYLQIAISFVGLNVALF
jgi:hypothetical protein